jgi:hypothetical protein
LYDNLFPASDLHSDVLQYHVLQLQRKYGKVYSAWLWLYFVVTVVLTAVVVVGTWMLWKTKEREIAKYAAIEVGKEM